MMLVACLVWFQYVLSRHTVSELQGTRHWVRAADHEFDPLGVVVSYCLLQSRKQGIGTPSDEDATGVCWVAAYVW